jgi:hypothetical protein
MEDLMCMAVFARVVEAKSFSGAARRLNVPSHGRPDLLISVIVATRPAGAIDKFPCAIFETVPQDPAQ